MYAEKLVKDKIDAKLKKEEEEELAKKKVVKRAYDVTT